MIKSKIINQLKLRCLFLISISLLASSHFAEAQLQKLRISDNKRFLVKEDGSPFVWIGETNWFFAKLPPHEIDSILDKRSSQGYTIMLVSCREKLHNGEGPGNMYSHNPDWWKYLDDYIRKCEQRNLYVGITLGWWGILMQNSEEDLYRFGKWVGNRYKDQKNIVWLTLGESGSHKRKNEIADTRLNSLVNGIRDGDTGNKLLTIHADYQRGTSLTNDGELSDFNNWQTSQWCCPDELPRKDDRSWAVWEAIKYDYERLYDGVPKPTIDIEAWYENNKDFCGTSPFIIRRRAYFTIFAGAFGHNYGAGGIWDGLGIERNCSGTAMAALHYAGAEQIGYVSKFLQSLSDDYLNIIPDQTLVVQGNSMNYDEHIQAVVSRDSSFALIYSACDNPYTLNLAGFAYEAMTSLWYNPRNHTVISGTQLKNDMNIRFEFDPPGEIGPGNDWILILGKKGFTNKILTDIEK